MTIHISACTNPELGSLLHGYELSTLSESDAVRFEDHLVECGYCVQQLSAPSAFPPMLSRYRSDVVTELKRSGDSFEAQVNRYNAKESAPGFFARFLRSAYTRYALAPVVAVGILTFVLVREKAPVPYYVNRSPELSSPSAPLGIDCLSTKISIEPPILLTEELSTQEQPAPHAAEKTLTQEELSPTDKVSREEFPTPKVVLQHTIPPAPTSANRELPSAMKMQTEPSSIPQQVLETKAQFESSADAAVMSTASQTIVPVLPQVASRLTKSSAEAAYNAQGYAEAIQELSGIVKAQPANADAWFYLAASRYFQAANAHDSEGLHEAESAFAEADRLLLKSDTLRPWLNLYRAHVAAEIGEDAVALKWLTKLNNAEARFQELAEPLKANLRAKTLPGKLK